MRVYEAVVTQAKRYVQGGGCTTVGVAGLIQSGGFGSFSRKFGLAAASLLEAEIVTADGVVRIANACTNSDLFWALKGGGNSLGVLTRLTLATRELPAVFGGVLTHVTAKSDAAFRRLIERFVGFYAEGLFNPHWGESVAFRPDNTLSVTMVFQGIEQSQAEQIWRPFLDWIGRSPSDYSTPAPLIGGIPARDWWNADFLRKNLPGLIVSDPRPGALREDFWWAGDQGQVGWFLHGYTSAWLPAALLKGDQQARLAAAIRHVTHSEQETAAYLAHAAARTGW